jgi:hypothetical protein
VDYLMVRELKKEGFPGSEHWNLDNDDRLPDLGMLIQACGKRFRTLRRDRRDKWRAIGKSAVEIESTPEDAVGALWLYLEHNRRAGSKGEDAAETA